eukprot:Nitzschia sp. Nitz4//scaffold89_size161592//97391//98893//NITZ4_002386-RA/size161592-processed-gene-0.16-mRNA-1//1//CDS//3329559640//374//frame0
MSRKGFFSWCLPKSSVEIEDEDSSRTKPSPLRVNGDGVLRVPSYLTLPRESSRLLRACWAKDWDDVLACCRSHPEQACHRTQLSDRTALHLATFNQPCPLNVAQALLTANRHMVLVQDSLRYTPLHNVAYFPGESLVKLFCDTSIMVEQELQHTGLPPVSGTSPLFLAAKRGAPLRTLRALLETRTRTEWIAPSTGGEPYWMQTLDEYSSPLEILLRDRASATWFHKDILTTNGTLPTKLVRRMRQMALERLSQRRKDAQHGGDSHVEDLNAWTELETNALLLWSKSLELLAEHVPLLFDLDGQASTFPYAIVHCVASAKVPLYSLLQLVLTLFPEQALQHCEQGFLPLHHVLCADHPYTSQTLLTLLLATAPLAMRIPTRTSLHPRQPKRRPQFALALALEYKLPVHILHQLLRVESDETLCTMDDETGLFPFALAATKGYDIETIYDLLRAHPQVLQQQQQGGGGGGTSGNSMVTNSRDCTESTANVIVPPQTTVEAT